MASAADTAAFPPGDEVTLIAGTPWLWAREELRGSVDVLFVDEAGQMALADALAIAGAGRGMVLLGDPQQLAHVSQGTHPRGSGASVLEHLLGERETVPPAEGVFLERTWRMHPDVCRFVSSTMYDGRLRAGRGHRAPGGRLPRPLRRRACGCSRSSTPRTARARPRRPTGSPRRSRSCSTAAATPTWPARSAT